MGTTAENINTDLVTFVGLIMSWGTLYFIVKGLNNKYMYMFVGVLLMYSIVQNLLSITTNISDGSPSANSYWVVCIVVEGFFVKKIYESYSGVAGI